jgi:hypothetical protein
VNAIEGRMAYWVCWRVEGTRQRGWSRKVDRMALALAKGGA